MKAKTPKGRTVDVEAKPVSTGSEQGTVSYGGIKNSGWNPHGLGQRTLEEALVVADKRIDANGLEEDPS